MPHTVALIAALAVPIAALFILRINAAMVFLSLCLGYVLLQLVANDANSLISFLAPNAHSFGGVSWRLIILLLPAVLTSVIMVFSMRGRLKGFMNLLPAVAASVLGLLLVIPLLSPALRHSLQLESPLWQQISRAQSLIITGGALISLVFLWSQRRSAKKSE